MGKLDRAWSSSSCLSSRQPDKLVVVWTRRNRRICSKVRKMGSWDSMLGGRAGGGGGGGRWELMGECNQVHVISASAGRKEDEVREIRA